jgi:hypothetical protein
MNKELESMWEKICIVDYFRLSHDALLEILAETIQTSSKNNLCQ